MTEYYVKGQGLAFRAWQSLKIFGVVGLAAVSLAAANPVHSAPAIGAQNANTDSIGRYNTLELTFPVRTEAVSPFLPYDPAVPSYAANLRTTEDARYGISVDALLLPPGQTNWSKAQTWPCYWQEDFNAAGVATGSAEWHLRFAPTQVGTWHYELRATDASGSVTTAPAAFTCAASASKGFVHVSRTDSRYFEYDDGSPFIACGSNGATDTMYPIMAGIHAGGGTGLIRVWINAMGLIGGYNNSGEHLNGYAGSVVFSRLPHWPLLPLDALESGQRAAALLHDPTQHRLHHHRIRQGRRRLRRDIRICGHRLHSRAAGNVSRSRSAHPIRAAGRKFAGRSRAARYELPS